MQSISHAETDINFFSSLNNEKPTDRPPVLISEYIEKKRVMPSNTPFPGPYQNWRSPYAVGIMDCFSPYNPARYIDVMAAAQTVKSVTLENIIGYHMDANPSPMIFVSGTEALLDKWGPKRLEPLIDSLGVREKMVAPIENKASRSQGDKAQQKLFVGGFLEMASAQAPSSLRADSVKIILMDEVDSAPPDLSTGEGRWDKVVEARAKAWESRKKIGAFSTPTLYDQSIIYDRFLLGDQCLYFMPCPLCGKEILFRGLTHESGSGLRAETKNGEIEFIYYLCDYCNDAIFEHQKAEMMIKGKWIPQAKPERFRKSFSINSLYSPVGMYSWLSYWLDYQTALRTPDGMRSFVNLQDGMPYREKGSKPKLESVIELRGTYKQKTVPDQVLFLTMSVDVQRGTQDKKEPPRLEIEVLGHGARFRTASVLYKVIEGETDDPDSGAWKKMHEWAIETGLKFQRKDGFNFVVQTVFIDSSDNTSVVYSFCQKWKNTFPIKGTHALKKRKEELGDEAGPENFKRYRLSKSGETELYTISTNYYKKHIYNNLNNSIRIIEQDLDPDRPGFCDFPMDYSDQYFEMLTAEEHRRDGSFHKSRNKKNESLDLRVYNMCAGDVYLDRLVRDMKEAAKSAGADREDIKEINHEFVLRKLAAQVGKIL